VPVSRDGSKEVRERLSPAPSRRSAHATENGVPQEVCGQTEPLSGDHRTRSSPNLKRAAFPGFSPGAAPASMPRSALPKKRRDRTAIQRHQYSHSVVFRRDKTLFQTAAAAGYPLGPSTQDFCTLTTNDTSAEPHSKRKITKAGPGIRADAFPSFCGAANAPRSS